MSASRKNKKAIIASSTKDAADREAFFKNVKLEIDKQYKHIPGKHNYDSTKSVFEHHESQILLRKYCGSGTPCKGNMGEAGYQELVDFEEFIGYHPCDKTGTKTATTWGKIHYSNYSHGKTIPIIWNV